MHHLLAFTESIAQNAFVDVDALTDDIFTIANLHFLPREDYDLVFAWAGSATLDRARINTPSNRQISLPFIRPVNVGVLPANDPNLMDLLRTPFKVRAREELAIEGFQTSAGAERFTALFGLMQGRPEPIPAGDIYPLRWTSTTAAVANAWTTIAYTPADNLPVGRYAVIGSECVSTNAIAHRLNFQGQWMRPGFLSATGIGNRTHRMMYDFSLGTWGRFESYLLPIVQVLCNAADAAHTGHLWIVRIA